MENIKQHIKNILSYAEDEKKLKEFAEQKYNEKFADMERPIGTYHGYEKYTIISENTLKIHYLFGYANRQFTDNFIVEIE
jgi:hypothetical protein